MSIISNYFKELSSRADSRLESWASSTPFSHLLTPVHYSVLGEGKRLRAVLVYAAAELANVELSHVDDFAVAVELLHASSLIHDDLPCMDNGELRRGKPAAHKKFGENIALLTGDALIAEAFRVIACADLSPDASRALTKLLSSATIQLCEGQVMDLAATERVTKNTTFNTETEQGLLFERHQKKTGALIEAAIIGPLVLLSDTERAKYHDALSTYARELGLLFQITDDILDATASTETLGKMAQADEEQGTPNFVSLFGLTQAQELAAKAHDRATNSLRGFGSKAQFLLEIADLIRNRTR